MLKAKRARVKKRKQLSCKYEENLFSNNEYSEKFRFNFSRIKVVRGNIVDLQIIFLFEKMCLLSMIMLNKSTYPIQVKYF